MTLPLRKRTVHFYEIKVRSSTRKDIKSPSCASLADLLKCFAKMAKSGQLPQMIRKSSKLHTVLADWRYDQATNCYELLISKANAALSDVALRDLQTARLRKAGKTKAEGIEVSAHVLLRPNSDNRTALLLVTMGAGVGAQDIEVLLRHLSREAAKDPKNRSLFYFDDPSAAQDDKGNPLQYKVQYGFSAAGYQGQTLTAALQSGQFESMELIGHEVTPFDSGGNLQIKTRSVSIDAVVPKAVTGATIRNAVLSFQKLVSDVQYDQLRIHYKTVAGQRTSAMLEIGNLDAAFTLKDHIEFDTDVEAQQDTLNPLVLAKMKPLLQSVT